MFALFSHPPRAMMIIKGASWDPPVADDDQGWPPSPHGGGKRSSDEARGPTWGALFAPTTPQRAPLAPKSEMIGDDRGQSRMIGDDRRWDREHSAL